MLDLHFRDNPADVVGALTPPPTPTTSRLSSADRLAMTSLTQALLDARRAGDPRPAFAVVAASLSDVGVQLPATRMASLSLTDARDQWLRRLRSTNRSESSISAYRVALNDLVSFLERDGRATGSLDEQIVVAYLDDYRRRCAPAEATYYRRFIHLRRFFRWLSRASGIADPFLDLEPPGKPQREADWLTPEEFAVLLAAAGAPLRRRPGLAERDRLVLITLVSTGLRRSELLALDWRDLHLDGDDPSVLVRRGKGGKPRRQPLPTALADEFRRQRKVRNASGDDAVFCGLAGKRLSSTILATLIRRAADRAGLEKSVSAHTLRHTAATWLRQQTADARLVAAYLGHADLSTVSRYAHVSDPELHRAAEALSDQAMLVGALRHAH